MESTKEFRGSVKGNSGAADVLGAERVGLCSWCDEVATVTALTRYPEWWGLATHKDYACAAHSVHFNAYSDAVVSAL
jgi:hypothetical protein